MKRKRNKNERENKIKSTVNDLNKGIGQSMGIPLRRDPYVMEVDRGRNCYACRGFGHMACNYRNREQRERVADNRRVEYGGGRIEEIVNLTNNLKEDENLELLN